MIRLSASKWLIGAGICILACVSCAKIEFEDSQGNIARYSRFGRTDLKDIEYKNGAVRLKVGSAKGDSGNLGEALKYTAETMRNVSKAAASVP